MQTIDNLGYKVYFDKDFKALRSFLSESTYSQILILVDRNTNDHCLPVLQDALPELVDYDIIEIDPGEENKNIDFCIGVWSTMLDFGADRKALMINLGGGVVTDMGGFAASTYKRGVDFVHIPTTLLAQVDASIGGKTGIDMGNIKNIIGTFAQPKAVFINPKFLDTLDSRQLLSGLAEIIKHGLIQDMDLFNRCKTIDVNHIGDDIIYRSIELKNTVVLQDPIEQNLRKILNFGHTIGHAIESYSLAKDKEPLLHGEAIAIGMICESWLSYKNSGLSEAELQEITTELLKKFNIYQGFDPAHYNTLIEFMRNDKKNSDGKIGFALLASIGHAVHDAYLSEDDIKLALDYYLNLK